MVPSSLSSMDDVVPCLEHQWSILAVEAGHASLIL